MRNIKNFLLSTAVVVLAAGGPLTGPANAQPVPPPPPGVDLHVRVVDTPRPALRHEVRPERPGPNHVWVGGYWHHTGAEWTWIGGRWAEPPQRHAHWIAPRYERVKGGTRYVPGHWSHEHVIVD